MKRINFKLFFLLLILPLFGQTQIINHFKNPDSKWEEKKLWKMENGEWVESGIKHFYFFNGDTLINNEKWLKLTYDKYESGHLTSLNGTYGLIRSEGEKVYFFNPDLYPAIPPVLMYDFGLEVGDTFVLSRWTTSSAPISIPTTVKAVDSILVNETFHKRIFFNNTEHNGVTVLLEDYWIEGIGSNQRFLAIHSGIKKPTIDSTFLSCTYTNNQYVWSIPDYNDCDLWMYSLDVENEVPFMELELFPNPTNKFLNISSNGMNDVQKIQIHDVSGRLISTTETNKNTTNNVVMDISTLKNGVYICTLKGFKNHISKKFIKQ